MQKMKYEDAKNITEQALNIISSGEIEYAGNNPGIFIQMDYFSEEDVIKLSNTLRFIVTSFYANDKDKEFPNIAIGSYNIQNSVNNQDRGTLFGISVMSENRNVETAVQNLNAFKRDAGEFVKDLTVVEVEDFKSFIEEMQKVNKDLDLQFGK